MAPKTNKNGSKNGTKVYRKGGGQDSARCSSMRQEAAEGGKNQAKKQITADISSQIRTQVCDYQIWQKGTWHSFCNRPSGRCRQMFGSMFAPVLSPFWGPLWVPKSAPKPFPKSVQWSRFSTNLFWILSPKLQTNWKWAGLGSKIGPRQLTERTWSLLKMSISFPSCNEFGTSTLRRDPHESQVASQKPSKVPSWYQQKKTSTFRPQLGLESPRMCSKRTPIWYLKSVRQNYQPRLVDPGRPSNGLKAWTCRSN